jgi:hypothetical protein
MAEPNEKVFVSYQATQDPSETQQLREKMGELTFPWNTGRGVMVRYSAVPDIDAFVLRAVIDSGLQPEWSGGDETCWGLSKILIQRLR